MKKMFFSAMALVAFTATSMAGEIEKKEIKNLKIKQTYGVCVVTVTVTDEDGRVISSQNFYDFLSPSEAACRNFAIRMRAKVLSAF